MLFVDDKGHRLNPSGTGFWINIDEDTTAFITNAHNVNAGLVNSEYKDHKLEKMEIELRELIDKEDGKKVVKTETDLVHVEFEEIIQHNTADVAILVNPRYGEGGKPISPMHIPKEEIADRSYFSEAVGVCDEANFIGFATYIRGKMRFNLWDTASNLPIIRPANISSVPHLDFKNQAIRTSDVCLVSGLSFSGSSGSPVFSRQKDVVFNHETQQLHGGIAKAKLIGIMSGHVWDEPREEEVHSGISYFTKSTAILELIETYFTKDYGAAPEN